MQTSSNKIESEQGSSNMSNTQAHNQSGHQTINHPDNQSLHQSMTRPNNQSMNQQMHQPMIQSMTPPMNINQSMTHPSNQSILQPISQSMNPVLNHTINQTINQSMNQMNPMMHHMQNGYIHQMPHTNYVQHQAMNPSINQSINHTLNQSINHPINIPINQQMNPAMNQTMINQSIQQSVNPNMNHHNQSMNHLNSSIAFNQAMNQHSQVINQHNQAINHHNQPIGQPNPVFNQTINQSNNQSLVLVGDPTDWKVQNEAGMVLHRHQSINPSINLLDQAINHLELAVMYSPPDCMTARNNLAVVRTDLGTRYKLSGLIDQSINQYNQAINLHPSYAPAYFNLAVIYSEACQYDTALRYYLTAISHNPLYVEALCNIGVLYKNAHQLNTAIEYYERALAINPNFAVAASNLAIALTDQGTAVKNEGRTDEGIFFYKKALHANSKYAAAWYNLGVAFAEKQRYEDAKVCYEMCVLFDSKCAEAMNNLGVIYKDKGNLDQAVYYYHEALKANPTFSQTLNNLSVIYTMLGKLDEAYEYCLAKGTKIALAEGLTRRIEDFEKSINQSIKLLNDHSSDDLQSINRSINQTNKQSSDELGAQSTELSGAVNVWCYNSNEQTGEQSINQSTDQSKGLIISEAGPLLKQGSQHCLVVRLIDGRELVCTPNHRLLVDQLIDRSITLSSEQFTAGSISNSDHSSIEQSAELSLSQSSKLSRQEYWLQAEHVKPGFHQIVVGPTLPDCWIDNESVQPENPLLIYFLNLFSNQSIDQSMKNQSNYQSLNQSLLMAFARIQGIMLASQLVNQSRTVSNNFSSRVETLTFKHMVDAQSFVRDVNLVLDFTITHSTDPLSHRFSDCSIDCAPDRSTVSVDLPVKLLKFMYQSNDQLAWPQWINNSIDKSIHLSTDRADPLLDNHSRAFVREFVAACCGTLINQSIDQSLRESMPEIGNTTSWCPVLIHLPTTQSVYHSSNREIKQHIHSLLIDLMDIESSSISIEDAGILIDCSASRTIDMFVRLIGVRYQSLLTMQLSLIVANNEANSWPEFTNESTDQAVTQPIKYSPLEFVSMCCAFDLFNLPHKCLQSHTRSISQSPQQSASAYFLPTFSLPVQSVNQSTNQRFMQSIQPLIHQSVTQPPNDSHHQSLTQTNNHLIECETFDLSIPHIHNFVANGLIVHNCSRAIVSNPHYAEALNNLGVLYRDEGLIEQSINSYMECLLIDRSSKNAAQNRLLALNSLTRVEPLLKQMKYFDPSFNQTINPLQMSNPVSQMNNQSTIQLNSQSLGQSVTQEEHDQMLLDAVYEAHHQWGMSFSAQYAANRFTDWPHNRANKHDNSENNTSSNQSVGHASHQSSPTNQSTKSSVSQSTSQSASQHVHPPLNMLKDRVLRIGYLSADFFTHSVSYFIDSPIKHSDKQSYHVTCYSNVSRRDLKTNYFESIADCFRSISDQSAVQVANQIRADRIDILIECTGHTAGNRLDVCSLKPAPIQMTWIGYPNTTGLSEIDYRITDHVVDPVDTTQKFTERLLRFPSHPFLCYTPPADAPAVGDTPALKNGYITFGSFNSLAKINDHVLSLWCAILTAVPYSRMLIKCKPFASPTVQAKMQQRFAQHGISSSRLDLIALLPTTSEHLEAYNLVDISVDTFPYSGTTTTCEALHSGVPVITYQRTKPNQHAHSVGATLISRFPPAIADKLIAKSEQEYVQLAVKLAQDIKQLNDMRKSLRQALLNSSVCDGKQSTKELESMFRGVWHEYVDQYGDGQSSQGE